jgi:hypothetical protein
MADLQNEMASQRVQLEAAQDAAKALTHQAATGVYICVYKVLTNQAATGRNSQKSELSLIHIEILTRSWRLRISDSQSGVGSSEG